MSKEQVVLVDVYDIPIGTMDKQEAHVKGLLHRAFSIFVFNDEGLLLMQRRASAKYHSGGLWTNTCCSHPRPNEVMEEAIHRRLQEEMGFDCDLKKVLTKTYNLPVGNALMEHELNHVHIGKWNGTPKINPEEADEWQWMPIEALRKSMEAAPQDYTSWFIALFEQVLKML